MKKFKRIVLFKLIKQKIKPKNDYRILCLKKNRLYKKKLNNKNLKKNLQRSKLLNWRTFHKKFKKKIRKFSRTQLNNKSL